MFTDTDGQNLAGSANLTAESALEHPVLEQEGPITTEVRKKMQADLDRTIEELRKLKHNFSEADFDAMFEEKKRVVSRAQELMSQFAALFNNADIKVKGLFEFNPEEQKIITDAEQLYQLMTQQFSVATEKYEQLLNKPRKGIINKIVNFFSNLEEKTKEAEVAKKVAEAKKLASQLAVPKAEDRANLMKEARIEKMSDTQLIDEMTAVVENLRKEQSDNRKDTAEKVKHTREVVDTTKIDIKKFTEQRDDTAKRITQKTDEINLLSLKLKDATPDSSEAIAIESELDTAKAQLNSLLGMHDKYVASLETSRLQLEKYAAQDKQLTTQYNALDLTISILDINIPYIKNSIQNQILMSKNANSIAVFSTQHKTTHALDEGMLKMAHMMGLSSQKTVEETFKEQKAHAETARKMIVEAGTAYVQNQKNIEHAKELLDNAGKDGNTPSSQEGGTGGSNFDPNNI